MNPNSQNQRWSKWVFFVEPGRIFRRAWTDVESNCARFGRKAFGSASQMRVRHQQRIGRSSGYLIEVLTEGSPVHDPQFQNYMRENWQRFFQQGFGPNTRMRMTAKLMAGSRQDGTPRAQMLIMPAMDFLARAH